MKALISILILVCSLSVFAGSEKSEFSGIISLSGTSCSASLVKLKGLNLKNALVLTNGHCLGGYIRPDEAIEDLKLNQPIASYSNLPKGIASRLSMGLRAGLFDNRGVFRTSIDIARVVYATMTNTDLALLELNKTYEQIYNKYKIKPFTIAQDGPSRGYNITILSGYKKKKFTCSIENIAHKVKEYKWFWLDSIGYTEECKVMPGTSGSPIISDQTGEVIGVNNSTTIDGGDKACSLNNPCEISEDGEIFSLKGKGYGQNVHWIYDCLSTQSLTTLGFDFNQSGCRLPSAGL